MRLMNLILATVLVLASAAQAAEIRDLVRLKGSETSKLTGMGLVVGLNGTGDGGKFLPAMRPLAEMIGHLGDPNVVAAELQNVKNVALVSLSAELPGNGVREGDRIDVHVAAMGAASSLRGGRLLIIPMKGPLRNSGVYAFAEGAVIIEDEAHPTVGVVRGGGQLTADVFSQNVDEFGRITLVLRDEVAGWRVATTLAGIINSIESVDEDSPTIARARDQKNVVVQIPPAERHDPATFIALILSQYVDPGLIDIGARVVINERTQTIVINGEVQISPVVISHKGLTITTISPEAEPTVQNPRVEQRPWASLDPHRRGGTKLADLIEALKQLQVEADDRIAILKEIHKSGSLHAQLIFE